VAIIPVLDGNLRSFWTYGVLIRLIPGDASLLFELQRAPDVSGAPGAWGTIATPGPFSLQGGTYFDIRPSKTTSWYRARHIGAAVDPGPWSDAVASGSYIISQPMMTAALETGTAAVQSVVDGQATTPSIAPRAIEASRAGASLVQDLAGITSRTRLFNGGADLGTGYWNSNPTGRVTAVNDGDTYPASPSYSFKLQHDAAGSEYMFQSTDPNPPDVANPMSANWAYFSVRPGRRVQIDYSTKVSGANVISRVFIAEYTASGGLLAVTQVGGDVTATAWGDYSVEFTVSASTFLVVPRFAVAGTSAGSVWYDELYFTDLIPVNDTTQGWLNLGLKSAGFTVDWQQGAIQFAEINGTALAITLVNPEPGGDYYLYLKQNSQPDTVTWPANVIWQNNTTPTLSTTTGRTDRIHLQWTGVVYYAEMVQWWPNTAIELLPTGISSGQAFGSLIVDRPHVNPTGIASGYASGAVEVIRDDPNPIILTANAGHISGGNICAAEGSAIVRVSWTVEDAPDGTHHIDIDGVVNDLLPSAGFYDIDTGFQQNLNGSTEVENFGPYTVRLVQNSGHVEKDNEVTNTAAIFYTFELCE